MARPRAAFATAEAPATEGKPKDCCGGWFCEICKVLNFFCLLKVEPMYQVETQHQRREMTRLRELVEQQEEEKNTERMKTGKAIRTIEFELRQVNDKQRLENEAEFALRKSRATSQISYQNIKQLEKHTKNLETQNKNLAGTVSRLRKTQGGHSKNDVCDELQRSQETVQALQKENESLQYFITGNKDEQESASDPEIVRLFGALRSGIQRIVMDFYQTDEEFRPDTSGLSAHDVDRLSYWTGGVRGSVIKSKLKGILFQLLFEHILSKQVFGLEGLGTTGHLEAELVGFERALNSLRNARDIDVANWRASTVKLAKLLNPMRSGPTAVAEANQTALRPLQKNERTVEARSAILDLCKDALEFTLVLRGLKDKYAIHIPEAQTALIPAEANSRPFFKDDKSDHDRESQKVAFTISGALFKYPESNPEKRLV